MNFDILKGLAWSRSLIFIRVSEGRRDRWLFATVCSNKEGQCRGRP